MKYLTMTLVGILVVSSASAEIKRTGNGKPDLSGFYDSGTLTPVDRPKEFGDKQFMSAEEAAAIVERTKSGLAAANRESDPDRDAPVQGGDGNNNSGAGGVGGAGGTIMYSGGGSPEPRSPLPSVVERGQINRGPADRDAALRDACDAVGGTGIAGRWVAGLLRSGVGW